MNETIKRINQKTIPKKWVDPKEIGGRLLEEEKK